jgi:hypothetical protein
MPSFYGYPITFKPVVVGSCIGEILQKLYTVTQEGNRNACDVAIEILVLFCFARFCAIQLSEICQQAFIIRDHVRRHIVQLIHA